MVVPPGPAGCVLLSLKSSFNGNFRTEMSSSDGSMTSTSASDYQLSLEGDVKRVKRPKDVVWEAGDDTPLAKWIHQKRIKKCKTLEKLDRNAPSTCALCSISVTSIEDGIGIFEDLAVTEDADPSKMIERKWALAEGRFKMLTKDEARDLEESEDFKEAVQRGRPKGLVRYSEKPDGYSEDELFSSSKPCIRDLRTRYSNIKAHHPGIDHRHHVVWTTRSGKIFIDRGVKLYSISSVKCHQIEVDCRGPKSPWFALVDPALTKTCDGRVHFDANLFWTSALLFKHFNTSGIESWDAQIDDLRKQVLKMRSDALDLNSNFVSGNHQQHHILANLAPPRILPILQAPPPPFLIPPPNFLQCLHPEANNSTQISSRELQYEPELEPNDCSFTRLSNRRYTGSVKCWKRTFGFITCDHIPGPVFLHSNDLVNWNDQIIITLGMSVSFIVHFNETKGYKAYDAKLFL